MNRFDGKPLVYFISDGSINNDNYEARSKVFLDQLRRAVSAGIPLAQIREKQLSTRLLFDLASKARSITDGSKTSLLINDRLDVALAAGADGVHLTSKSIPIAAVRSAVPAAFVIGVSTHSVDEVVAAANASANFAVYGPVFDTPGKGKAVGLRSLREAALAAKDLSVLGLGGIDASNYREVLQSGADGFAAIRFFNDPNNLELLKAEFDL